MKYFIAIFLLSAGLHANAQVNKAADKKADITKEIMKMDSLLFIAGFNNCDTVVYKKILSDSIEFYDDRAGLNTSKDLEIKFIVEKCAAKHNMTRVLKSTTVTRLGNYGAVQLGEHDFVINGITVGSGRFIHIWERTTTGWKLKRVVSYEHVSTGK